MICMKKAMLALALALAMVACATVVTDSSDADATGLEYRATLDKVTIIGYTGDDKVVTIPETIDGGTVKEISNSAFEGSDITEVIIPKSVELIGDFAFSSCTSLEYVTIEGSVTIGKSAFDGCTALKLVDFKAVPGTIGQDAFNLKSTTNSSFRAPEDVSLEGCTGETIFEKISIDKKIVRYETSGQVPKEVGDLGFEVKNSGDDVKIPEAAVQHGYDIKVFNGETELNAEEIKVTDEDLKLTLQYTYSLFTVEFKVDDEVYVTMDLSYLDEITLPEPPEKETDAQYIYTFKEWDGYTAGMTVKDNVVFDAVFDEKLREYTIKFVADGKEISSKVMKYGETIVPPEDPKKVSEDGIDYRFNGWSGYTSGMTVTGDTTFLAIFVESDHEYTIKFVVDGKTVKEEKLLYQEEITAPEDPVKEDARAVGSTNISAASARSVSLTFLRPPLDASLPEYRLPMSIATPMAIRPRLTVESENPTSSSRIGVM